MKNNLIFCNHQRKAVLSKGGMLLEVLVAILIIAFGILGLIGLQSRAVGYVDESGYRSDAVYLAGAYAAELWAVGLGAAAGYLDNAGSGSPYERFSQRVAELPRAAEAATLTGRRNPGVTTDTAPGGGTSVTIEILWMMPGDPNVVTAVHSYRQVTVLGFNP